MSLLTGLVGHGDENTDRIRIEMSDTIRAYDQDATPLFVLSGKLKKDSVANPTFKWMEDDARGIWASMTTTDNTVTLSTSDGTIFQVGDILKNARTAETARVTSIATNVLTVTRSWGTVASTAMVAGDWLVNLSGAYAEGATNAAARVTSPSTITNYTQTGCAAA